MEYRTVFDVSTLRFELWPIVICASGASAVGICYVLYLHSRLRKASIIGPLPVAPKLLTVAAALVAILPIVFVYLPRVRAARVLEHGKAHFVEGVIDYFKPMPPTEHTTEDFTVAGTTFSYFRGLSPASFHQTALDNGPIHEGVYVRLWHVNGNILKLEIRQTAEPGAPL